MIGSVIVALAAWAATASPQTAIALVTWAAGRPDLAAELVKICRVESAGCRAIGVHGTRHNPPGRIFYAAAIGYGLARPAECPDTHGRHTADAWGPRGAFGLAGYRAAAVGRCASPQILDVPIVSAAIALAHLVELERRGFCDPARRRAAWRMGIRRARDHRCLTDARARFR